VVLVLQTFGNENEYRRAIFAIWSFYAYSSKPVSATEVILFTDQPDFFSLFLRDLPVRYMFLSPAKIKAMRGAVDFTHRMKIALIEESFDLAKSNLLYVDSDTFFVENICVIENAVDSKNAFMHKMEYDFASLAKMRLPAAVPFHAFLKIIREDVFLLANNDSIKVDESQFSWNAGAMFLNYSHVRFIPDVYKLTEQFYKSTKNHASEQYAFSIILQNNTKLKSLEQFIFHYWYRIDKKIADDFFSGKITSTWAALSKEEKLWDAKKWTQFLPGYFNNHILTLRDTAIQLFNEDMFRKGYRFSIRAIMKDPFNFKFIRDILYHTKRAILKT
jgi:hypothetical protein